MCPQTLPAVPDAEDLLALRLPPGAHAGWSVSRAKGCSACLHTGYTGRVGLYEILRMTTTLREMVMTGAPDHDIQREALASGMVTLFQGGVEKVRQGVTGVEELLRVVEVEDAYETLCAHCHGVLHADFLTCPACGTPVANRCRQCGSIQRPEWTFCPRCRRKEDHPATVVTPFPVPGRRGRRAVNE